MAVEPSDRVRELFFAVLDEPGERRSDFLDERCAGDAALRAAIEELLHHHATTDAFMHRPARTKIGRFEVLHVIASGGMGTVYEAVQDRPHRRVALKVLRSGAASVQALKRFSHEVEILGRLRHPNIAQIYEAGTFDEGAGAQPYFAMELISGRPLVEYAEAAELGTRQRLDLVVRICDAVQYAHYRGVIHRDLKPDNILVDEQGEPKVLDFGVARATDSDIQVTTLQTDIGQLIGTIPYMSPEQVSGDPEHLDTRSDVYSLGVVMYELLTGHLPHELTDKTIPEAVRIIGEEDPQRLSTIDRTLRGDLDTIVAKALEKDKTRRYQSAGELGADIRHHLDDEPITARPASTFYQLSKFARRNKALVSGVTAVIVVLVAGVVGIGIALTQARDEARKAALSNEFLRDMLMSVRPFKTGPGDLTVVELLDQSVGRIDEGFADYPEVAVTLHLTVGETYRHLGSLQKAEIELRKAFERGEQVLGQDHGDTLEALRHLVDVIGKQGGRSAEAVELARLHLKRQSRVGGAFQPKTIRSMRGVSWALRKSARDEDDTEAELLLRQALKRSTDALGPAHRETIFSAMVLGNLLLLKCEFEEAEGLLRKSYDWCSQRDDAAWTCARGQFDLSFAVGILGDPQQGAELAEHAYLRLIETLGPQANFTRTAVRYLGLNLQWSGRAAEAEQKFVSLIENTRQPALLASFFLTRLRLLEATVSPEEALPILERLVAARSNPPRSPFDEMGLTALAHCLVRLGRFEEAEATMQHNPGRLVDAIHPHHYERRLYLDTLAKIHEGLRRPEKAAEYRVLLREAEGADEAEASD